MSGFDAFAENSDADFTYKDVSGVLTKEIFGDALYGAWHRQWPTYHIEVKSTAGMRDVPFHISQSQLHTVSRSR